MIYLTVDVQNAVELIKALKNEDHLSLVEYAKDATISYEFLGQIAYKMRKAGILGSMRGPGGGYFLKNYDVTLLDLVKVFKRKREAQECELLSQIHAAFDGIRILQ